MSVKDKVEAIDRFVRTIKESGVYDDINAACIMAGWTNLAGALTPFKGAAPTNGGGLFQNADLDPGIGLKGDGSTKYLNANRAVNVDGDNDHHIATLVTSGSVSTGKHAIGAMSTASSYTIAGYSMYSRATSSAGISEATTGLLGLSRQSLSEYSYIKSSAAPVVQAAVSVAANISANHFVFAYSNAAGSPVGRTDARLSWYSIGSSTDLAALDSAVSTLMADLRSIDEAGFDRDALAYIRAVEAADGAYLETGVKKAINRFIVGLKKDNLWDALKASCILCGARTIAGALVPLAGTAPTGENLIGSDYNRETGILSDGSGKSVNTNRNANDDQQDSFHMGAYVSTFPSTGTYIMGDKYGASVGWNAIYRPGAVPGNTSFACRYGAQRNIASQAAGYIGISRSQAASYVARVGGSSTTVTHVSLAPQALPLRVFASSSGTDGSANEWSNARIAFYSIGSAISDLALLDARVTTLVSEIAAAIP